MTSRQRSGGRGASAQDVSYRWLKEHIASLPRQEGVFLTEGEVAEAAGTSRTPVREALLRLEAEGAVQLVRQKGAFVPPISDSEVQSVMQARALVEDWSVRQVMPASPELVDELERLVAEQENLLEDPVAFIDCDRVFHRAVVRQAGNPVLTEFYESLRERQVRMGLHAVAAAENRVRTVLAEHSEIVAAIRSGDAEKAAFAVAAHLTSTLKVLNLPDVLGQLSSPLWNRQGK